MDVQWRGKEGGGGREGHRGGEVQRAALNESSDARDARYLVDAGACIVPQIDINVTSYGLYSPVTSSIIFQENYINLSFYIVSVK